jgi:hypothetical protein
MDACTTAKATIQYEKDGKLKEQTGSGPRDTMKNVVNDLENASAVGQLHAG